MSINIYCGQEPLRRNGVALRVKKKKKEQEKKSQNTVLGCNIQNNRVILVHLQGKPFNITVFQVYAPTTDAEEAKVDCFYEDLEDLLEQQQKMSFSS